MTTFTLDDVRLLHKQGFAIHWLRPKSKVPLNSGWTKGPRRDFDSLTREYKKGYNVGVRLGSASKIEDGYLAVIDLDVKSDNPAHAKEAKSKLFEIFPEAKDAPFVLSGRGNGSAHYYVRLKTPISGGECKGRSSDMVKVVMPSVEPSKRERAELSAKELAQGVRLRQAWEISLMSEGRQVVLPGSIHPDTGKEYRWGNPGGVASRLIPSLRVQPGKSTALSSKLNLSERPETGHAPRAFESVDVNSLGLRAEQVAQITSGDGVTDRSATCFAICMALLKRGVSEGKIISLLTDRRHFLGATAFEHAKTENRNRAAFWLEKYCLTKAKQKVSESAFDHEVIEVPGVSAPSLPSLALALDWQKELDLQRGPAGAPPTLRATYKNVRLILQNEIGADLMRRDLFANEDSFGCETPWGYKKGHKRSSNQDDALKIKTWLISSYAVEASLSMIEEAMDSIAGENTFHPVKDFLEGLEWDGVSRVEDAFKTYIGAKMPEVYLKAVSRKFFLALMGRIYEPGIKFDHLPVFEGKQGVGKSTFGSILVGEDWHMDGLPDLADKDAALNLQGVWLVEMAELSSLYRSQLEAAKAFISRQTDKVRPPYGKRRVDYARSCVFYGTTNARDYLTDPTGNRRFWPVAVSGCDFKRLKRDRLQLLAEAKFLWDFCKEPLWLQGKAKEQATLIQESRRVEDDGDSMQAKFLNWLDEKPGERSGAIDLVMGFQLDELFDGPFALVPKTMATRKSAAEVLRRAGFRRVHTMRGKRWKRLKDKKKDPQS